MNATYPWKRYWVARDSGYTPDGGFLADPESEYAWADANPAKSLAELRDYPALVLLGEAGMGKSRALHQEYEALRKSPPENTHLFYRNLNTYGTGEQRRLSEELFQGEEYKAYRRGARLIIFLDSLDEAINDIPRLDNWLADQLSNQVTYPERLQFRIASRTASWSDSLEAALNQIWTVEKYDTGVAAFEICPLRRVDIEEAAKFKQFDAVTFLDEIRNKEIEALANRPVTLEFLLSQWEKDRSLSKSKAELYETGILALCEENNPERRSRSLLGDPQQRMAIAGRIACALMLCGHSALWLGRIQDTPPGDIHLSELTSKEKHHSGFFQVDENILRETLNIAGLFTGHGRDRMGFAHQSFAEFLAAWYLQRTGNELDQILRPLRHQEGDRIVPKLQETAAWLATLNRSALERLIDEEPSLLLHVDGAALTDIDKAHLVQALLDRIAAQTLFPRDMPERPLRKLSHPDIAKQLRPWIMGREHSRNIRDFAMDLARWCKVQALAVDLAQVALDPSEEYMLRIAACHAVTWIENDAALAALKPLALGQAGPDPDRRLKNLTLRALWPRHLTADEFFDEPIDTGDQHSSGSLNVEIHSGAFFTTLQKPHMLAALDWVRRHSNHHQSWSCRNFSAGLLRSAWQWVGHPEILEAFALAALSLLGESEHLFHEYGYALPDNPLDNTEKRRALLAKLMGMLAPDKVNTLVYSEDRIARADDLPWLFDLLSAGLPENQHRSAAALINALLRYDTPTAIINLVLDRCGIAAKNTDLFLRKELAWFTHPMRFKTSHVQQIRKSWQANLERKHSRAPVLLDPPPKERVRIVLERVEQGDWEAWPDLAMELTLEPTSRQYEGWPHNLQKQPGWLEASVEIRARIQSVALDFLINTAPDSEKLFSSTSFSVSDMAGLFAFELLTQTAPARLHELTAEHWATWAPLLVAGYHENREWQQALRHEANAHAPEAVLEAILNRVDKEDRSEHGLSSLHDFDDLWSPPLVEELLVRLDDTSFKTQSRRTILEHLLRRGEPAGRRCAQAMLAQTHDADLRRHAAALLLIWDAAASWPVLAPLLEQESEFSKAFMGEAAHGMRWTQDDFPKQGLDEEQSADLFLWLEKHFPASESENRAHSREIDYIQDYRERLINSLKAAGTWTAVHALERIAAALPDRVWLKWVCVHAREQAMNNQWQAPSWEELSALLADPRSRLIRTEEDLLRVVLESLGRLQDSLRGVTPMAPFLWDEGSDKKPKNEGRLSDFVKFHLSNDLNRRGILINREVEIRNLPGKGRGESLDLLVQATNHMGIPVAVVVEAKGCWNTGLDTAMETQLRDQYLVGTSHRHGIYLVGWYGQPMKEAGCKRELTELRTQLDEQANALSSGGLGFRAIVLDLSLSSPQLG